MPPLPEGSCDLVDVGVVFAALDVLGEVFPEAKVEFAVKNGYAEARARAAAGARL
jgi:hypothetical protein